MIEIKIHSNENNRLCSIKGVECDYSGKQYLVKLLSKLFELTAYTLIRVRRNDYLTSTIDKLRKEGESLGVRNLEIDSNLFEVSFYCSNNEFQYNLLLLLADLWFSYQQPIFCFYLDEKEFKENYHDTVTKNLSWKQISDKSQVYLMFKGAEEDVIWLGRSSIIDFDLRLGL